MPYKIMITKFIFLTTEYLLAMFAIFISLGSLPGYIASILASVYFASMLKVNVVNPFYDGSWSKYIKSIFTPKK